MGNDYFNSGVALINCDRWKQLDFSSKWPQLLAEGVQRGFEYADQCVLNFMCSNEVNYISVKYNTLARTRRVNHQISPYILHFAGDVKPWHYSIFDLQILRGVLLPKDVYKYLKYQSQLIREVKTKDRALGLNLKREGLRIRRKH
jgi:lipopolysaccharide biosynthesis glycosyltransferase